MTLSALFSVNGSTTVQAHPANYDATVTFVIQSLTGIETIAWSVVGTSKSDQAALAVSLSGTPSGATATVTMPSDPGDGLGRAFMMKLRVTGEGTSAVHYAIFGKANSAGIIPAVVGEENVRNATHGWTDIFNQALNAIGGAAGSSGQLLYNNAGAIDGASGITVVGSETALAFGATPATSGAIRGSNGFTLQVRNAGNTANITTLFLGGDDVVYVGDGTTNPELDLRAANFVDIDIGVNLEYRFSSAAFDMNGNNLQEVGDFDHDGTNLGFYGTAPTTKKTVMGARNGNAALASLLTQLAAYGLLTDSTTET